MAASNSAQVRVGVTGTLYSGVVGTAAAPTTIATAWGGTWTDLGLLDEAGVEITPSIDMKDLPAWQSFYPVRSVVTARSIEVKFSLIQSNSDSFKLAFGGGSFAPTSTTYSTYTPPAASFVDERAIGLELTDGTMIDRWVFPRTIVSSVENLTFKKDESVTFGLTLKVLSPSSGSIFSYISNSTTAYPS